MRVVVDAPRGMSRTSCASRLWRMRVRLNGRARESKHVSHTQCAWSTQRHAPVHVRSIDKHRRTLKDEDSGTETHREVAGSRWNIPNNEKGRRWQGDRGKESGAGVRGREGRAKGVKVEEGGKVGSKRGRVAEVKVDRRRRMGEEGRCR
eukprot:5709967-Pleurochrysis_carterae.AAC.1